MRALVMRTVIGLCLAMAGCVTAPPGTTTQDSRSLNRIEHIVVIYAENRSFDNLYGLFQGANGINNAAPSTWTQTDRNGAPLATLPPVWKSGATNSCGCGRVIS